jgi:hypothetical protein
MNACASFRSLAQKTVFVVSYFERYVLNASEKEFQLEEGDGKTV